jgi:hypothetical protein
MTPRKWLWRIILLAAIGVLVIWIARTGRRAPEDKLEEQAHPVQTSSEVSQGPGGKTILTLDQAAQQRIRLEIQSLSKQMHQAEATAYGRLQQDPSKTFTLRAPVAGVLRAPSGGKWPDVGVELPPAAVAGLIEPIVVPTEQINLNSQLAMAQADEAASVASLAATRAEYERAKELNAEGKIVSDRDLQVAKAGMQSDEARLKAAQERVKLIQASLVARRGPTGPTPLFVQPGGQVVEVRALPGEAVQPGQFILRTARFDELIAVVALPPGRPLSPASVSSARIVPMGHEEHPLIGEKIALAAKVLPETLGNTLLFRVRPGQSSLRPGAAVTAYLTLAGKPEEGVVIPREAAVWADGKSWAYVEVKQSQFTRREVPEDQPTANGWFTRTGFAPGERVVTRGAQQLLSEEFRAQIHPAD